MGWICRSAAERGANNMMNKDYMGRGNTRGCGTARNGERAEGCGICHMLRGEARSERPRCQNGQTARWMRRLQVLDFALQELTLYLDMYPDCHRAMAKFHALREERAKVLQVLEASGTPITALGNDSHEAWDWIDSPWPWEYDFVGNDKA